LPVAKTLTRLVLSCRYCKEVDMKELGKWLPNLRHLTIAAPLDASILTEKSLKAFSKLEELIIYDSNVKGIKSGAFQATQALKHLTIKYASINEIKHEHLEGLEDTSESLTIVGTPIKHINVSQMVHLNVLDVSQNHLTTIERNMLPEKAQFSELNFSHNPIKHLQHGFLSGIELKNHVIHMRGLDIEWFDLNALEGIEKLWVVDMTQNLKMKKLNVTDYTKLPSDLQRIIVGRSPHLILDNEKGHISKMMQENNITLVIEGKIACCCQMQWMHEIQKDHPELIEIDRSRAMCSREGTKVDKHMPEEFWKNPRVVNFLKAMKDDKIGMCKKVEEKNEDKPKGDAN
jgi:Leucine-rich repeat (LRR) protein